MIGKYYCDKQSKLVWTMLGHSLEYRNELLPPSRNTLSWSLLEKSQFNLMLAAATSPHIILRGFESQGKLETIRSLNDKIAGNHYEVDMSFNYPIQTATLFVYGMISGGYWLTFKNMEKAPTELLSILASFADEIRQSVAANRSKIKVYGEELLIKGSHLIMCTFNINSHRDLMNFESLASNITD